jgi:hypothetical protein
MRIRTLRLVAALFAISVFSFCKNDASASKSETTDTGATVAQSPEAQPSTGIPGLDPVGAAPATPSTAATPTEPPQNAEGVWHYTCPKGCAGGNGSAVPCAKCGTTLVHNALYHGKPNPAAATPTPPGQTLPAGQTPPPPKAEPAQNAAGVWHYVCSAGCAGGAGSAIACATCGKPLQHNQKYHQ